MVVTWKVPKEPERAHLRSAKALGCFLGLSAVTFVLVVIVKSGLDLIVPHLPWIPDDYQDPDPPLLTLAAHCTALVAALTSVAWLLFYVKVPSATVTIDEEGVLIRFGRKDTRYSYSSIGRATVSRDVLKPEYRVLALLVPVGGSGQLEHWDKYFVAKEVDVETMVRLLESNGITVEHLDVLA
jgi:hypothetical protein